MPLLLLLLMMMMMMMTVVLSSQVTSALAGDWSKLSNRPVGQCHRPMSSRRSRGVRCENRRQLKNCPRRPSSSRDWNTTVTITNEKRQKWTEHNWIEPKYVSAVQLRIARTTLSERIGSSVYFISVRFAKCTIDQVQFTSAAFTHNSSYLMCLNTI